jgi:hypothetical protein
MARSYSLRSGRTLSTVSGPVKSARRIFSFLPIGSSKESNPTTASPTDSPRSTRPSPDQAIRDESSRNIPLAPRHASSPPPSLSSDLHLKANADPVEDLRLDLPLLPPPSLATLNQDPAGRMSDSSGSGPQSRRGSRPPSFAGVSTVGVRPPSRPGTPNESKASKRRSWMPTRSRAPSVENKNHEIEAWIAGVDPKIPYDLSLLAKSERVRATYFRLQR